jgi:hypothetical protein
VIAHCPVKVKREGRVAKVNTCSYVEAPAHSVSSPLATTCNDCSDVCADASTECCDIPLARVGAVSYNVDSV